MSRYVPQAIHFVGGLQGMGTDAGPAVSELLPQDTWKALEQDRDAVLVDVRTKAEWGFVGRPDVTTLGNTMLCVEWAQYPDMSVNPRFVEAVKEGLDGATPSTLYFICRSGARSMKAAKAILADDTGDSLSCDCVNVAEGFEGDLDAEHHRGGLNGWKARGLPWRQS